jgi:glycosyltransferase involved in cell wall biosynthesis
MTAKQVAYLHYWDIPERTASSIHVMKMCQALQQEGYQTTLFAPRAKGATFEPDAIWHHYGISTPFRLRLLNALPMLRGHDVAIRSAWSAWRQGVSLVFARNLIAGMWSAILGVPTIFEAHGPPGSSMGQHYLRVLIAQAGFKRLVVITSPLKEMYLERYAGMLRADQILVEPDAVDLERFDDLPGAGAARHALGIRDVFTAGYAGHLYPGRGIELIMELARRLPGVQFMLVGGSDEDIHEWRRWAEASHLPNVNLVGFVPNAALPRYLAACDILLMPYQKKVSVYGKIGNTVAWMSPMKMFEYMASGRTILSSDLPALREILNEGNAVLCDPEDADAWQQAIQQAIDDPMRAKQLAERARRDVERFTWRQRVRRILAGVLDT